MTNRISLLRAPSIILAVTLLAAAGWTAGDTGTAGKPDLSASRAVRSSAEVLAQIDKAGNTAPDWCDSTPLEYPDTLNLTWDTVTKKWDSERNLGQYLWSVVDADETKWKSGAKLLHHALEVNKANKVNLAKSMKALGHVYADLLCDYARGAYWYQAAEKSYGIDDYERVTLAMCYAKLGGRDLAMSTLAQTRTVGAGLTRTYAMMGEIDVAIDRASQLAKAFPSAGHLAAGDAYRRNARYDEALKHYNFILGISSREGELRRNKERASQAMEIMRGLKTLDLSRVPDGAYEAASRGYSGPVRVRVTVAGAAIASAAVVEHRESRALSANVFVPGQIVETQGFERLDAVTGATITSDAVTNAAVKALAAAMKRAGK